MLHKEFVNAFLIQRPAAVGLCPQIPGVSLAKVLSTFRFLQTAAEHSEPGLVLWSNVRQEIP
jgi:hypothetical protein